MLSMQRTLWETKFNLKKKCEKRKLTIKRFFFQVLLFSAWLYHFMTRLFGVMIQLVNGRFIALVIASFRRNLWSHFYDSGQYTEIETRARLLHCKSEVYCYCGKKANFTQPRTGT